MSRCNLCPRSCNIDREKQAGFCGIVGVDTVRAARAMLHFGEEPPISGTRGSGAVFFSGCNMRCCFCQNYGISHLCQGKDISVNRLSEIFLELQQQGAHNINLVTATHFIPQIARAIELAKPSLTIPVVYNCGGYEKVESLKLLKGLVDIYLPDVKYFSEEAAMKYSAAPRYFETAFDAVKEMVSQTGKYVIKEGIMEKGVIIRHLILPGNYKDSMALFEALSPFKDDVLVSLMRQYFPSGEAEKYPELDRRLTTFEYKKVLSKIEDIGFEGFTQDKSAATSEMTPDFDLSGI